MPERVMKYNPAFLTEDELIDSFVVRHTELELILEVIRSNTGDSNQHVLIVGPRGIGKTTLALRVAAEIQRDAQLTPKWYPIVFGEESYEVCSPGEFWLEALFHLMEKTKVQRWVRAYQDLKEERNEIRLRERALSQLLDFADEQGRRLLLIVENLNMILGQQVSSDDAWIIRHTLLNEPRLMLLGTATSRFEETENSDKAMYDLFKIQDLRPLNEDDCNVLWMVITGKELMPTRLRPIQILTGGNPRLLAIVANFGASTSFRELMLDLTHLVDDHTEYFKSHLDGLPALERKIFVALADLWDPSTARDVARAARVDVNSASSLLNRLVSRGAVVVFERKGRKKWYQVAERMYNIYHLMRRRGSASGRVWAVVNFMIHFYESEHPVRTVVSIAEEACKLDGGQRGDHLMAYETILQKLPSEDLRYLILKETPKTFLEMPDVEMSMRDAQIRKIADSVRGTSRSIHRKRRPGAKGEASSLPLSHRQPAAATSLVASGDDLLLNKQRYAEAEAAYREALSQNKEDPKIWLRLCLALREQPGRLGEAESACRRAIQFGPEQPVAWTQLGTLLHKQAERYEEAEAAYRRAIELRPSFAWPWGQLGLLLHEHLGRYEEAEAAYRKSIEIDPNDDWAWAQLGELLHEKLKRYDEAEAAYRKAIELDPDYAWAWGQLGALLHKELGRYEEAEGAYQKAIELSADLAWPWGQLGLLLHEHSDRYLEAEKAYRKAIELDLNYVWAWGSLGELLNEKLERHEEAEAAYRKAIELDPNYIWAWAQLGELLHEKLERYEEAETAYRRVIELDPANVWVWVRLGRLLHENLDRYGDAELAYRKAAELDADFAWPWGQLGLLLHEHLERYAEAEIAYRKALELQPVPGGWSKLGQLLHEKLARYEEAELAYREAIKLDPNHDWAWAQLGALLHEKLERYEEAEVAYRKATELDPKYVWAWAQLGALLHEKLERYEEAEVAYRRAIELEPKVAWGWARLGELLHERLGNYDEAQKAYRTALALDSKDSGTWQNLIKLQLDALRDTDAALQTAEAWLVSESRSASSLGQVACAFAERNRPALFPQIESWIREAMQKEPTASPLHIILSSLLGAMGKWPDALENISGFVAQGSNLEEYVRGITDLLIAAAASGYGRQAVALLARTQGATIFEPLLVGLRVYLGEEVVVAPEILEVGRDVAKRIEAFKEQMIQEGKNSQR